ncbi:MAG: LysM peptidoglycan-binding domain-containing protein, partial [Bdellovibrionales bacterium]|nr:LysM peptidoglycan-binding domain-containing protein [Bdellovibrionales bacterium]
MKSVSLTSLGARSFVYLAYCTLALLLLFGAPIESAYGQAEQYNRAAKPAFRIPKGLEDHFDFWILIFTRYGKDQRVFHHREYPGVIYSVLDFTEYERQYSGKKLQRVKENAADRETKRIRDALKHLGGGGGPRNSFERKIVEMFAKVPGRGSAKYREAASPETIRYQRGIKERFKEGIERSGRYLHAIEQIFEAEGLPPELGRLPLVESSFDYEAYSSVGAAGIWQFMRATGRRYMRITSSIDERRDPIIATRAAAKYLKHSYSRLESWPLAVTSYNHGLQGVLNAVNAVGSKELGTIVRKYKGRAFGFASGNFYAEFLAALEVDRNPQKYFPGVRREQAWRFDEVKLGRSIYFRDLARLSNTTHEELARLNLAFQKAVTTNRAQIPAGSVVKVHAGSGPQLIASVSKSELVPLVSATTVVARAKTTSRDEGSTYTVARGDTVGGIARRFGLSADDILAENGMSNARNLRAGQKLRLPSYVAVEKPAAVQKPAESDRAIITVKGEQAPAVASATAPQGPAPRSEGFHHTVGKGETVGAIARRFKVSTGDLMKLNGISDPRRLKVGQTVRIPSPNGIPDGQAEAAPLELATAAAVQHSAAQAVAQETPEKTQSYVVRSGDTLGGIAKRFGVSTRALMSTNKISDPRSMRIGKELTIPAAGEPPTTAVESPQ